MRAWLIIPVLVLTGCAGFHRIVVRPISAKQMPQLKVREKAEPPRPKFDAPHEAILLDPACAGKVQFIDGWCEESDVPGEYRCYQVRIRTSKACVVLESKPAPPPAPKTP